MNIRPYVSADLDAVVEVFTRAVHELAAVHYTSAQREAWAPRPPDREQMRRRLQQLRTLVALDGEQLAGFIAFEPDGHIDLAYVSPSYARQGVASTLYGRAEAALVSAGVTELFAEVSLAARPFFERIGFVVAAEQEVLLRGASFRRFDMRKLLDAARQSDRAVDCVF